MACVIIVPLGPLARFMGARCSDSDVRSQVFTFVSNLNCARICINLAASSPNEGRVVITTPDQLFHNSRLIEVLNDIGVDAVFFDEADAIIQRSTFRVSYSTITEWVRHQNAVQKTPVKLRFTTAILNERRKQLLLSKFFNLGLSRQIMANRMPFVPRQRSCHRLLERATAPNFRHHASKEARKEYSYRVAILY